jgi:LuxR family quorum-sensing system transcriptional regulator CciR
MKFIDQYTELHDSFAPNSEEISTNKTNLDKITPREVDCLHWTARGKTNWEIGQILEISENTVRFHLKNAFKKLGATSRARAVGTAINAGIIHL